MKMIAQTLAHSNSRRQLKCDPYRTRAGSEGEQTTARSQQALAGCECCGSRWRLILAEEAAALCRVSRRRIYCWIEAGALHFQELPDGAVLVCSRSLLNLVELHEGATGQLPPAPLA
jgi:hypothetical protein